MPVVLITGAGRRIGKGLALLFAESGWDVLIHYNKSHELANINKNRIIELGRKSLIYQANLESNNEIIRMFKEIQMNSLIPDVLVNNAGVFPTKKKLSELDQQQWDNTLNINLKAIYLMSKEFIKIANKSSRIINIASVGGLMIWNERIDYNVSKSALIQLTKALARELAPDFSVNTVCPGFVEFSDDNDDSDSLNGDRINIDKIPMKRFASVEDIFQAVFFFSTCSSYITGQIIVVDGGQSLTN